MSQILPVPEREAVEATPRNYVSKQVARLIFDRQGGVCWVCRGFLGLWPYEIDHIIPLELGGSRQLSNLQAVCVPCHKLKTKADIRAIAKARRLRLKANPETRPSPIRKLRSRNTFRDKGWVR